MDKIYDFLLKNVKEKYLIKEIGEYLEDFKFFVRQDENDLFEYYVPYDQGCDICSENEKKEIVAPFVKEKIISYSINRKKIDSKHWISLCDNCNNKKRTFGIIKDLNYWIFLDDDSFHQWRNFNYIKFESSYSKIEGNLSKIHKLDNMEDASKLLNEPIQWFFDMF